VGHRQLTRRLTRIRVIVEELLKIYNSLFRRELQPVHVIRVHHSWSIVSKVTCSEPQMLGIGAKLSLIGNFLKVLHRRLAAHIPLGVT
jgi:hypothetical protein